MKHTTIALTGLVALSGCSTAAVGSLPAVQTPAQGAATGTLQLAVGTARIGLNNGGSFVGLNVVATFRQPNGSSATLQNTPTLSGPAGTGVFGGGDSITGVTAYDLNQYATTPIAATRGQEYPTGAFEFGDLVGVYGYGLAPLNLVDYSENSKVFSSAAVCNGPIPAQPGGFANGAFYPSASPNRPDQTIPLPVIFSIGAGKVPAPLPPFSDCSQLLQLQGAGTPPAFSAVTPFRYLGGPPAWPFATGPNIAAGFQGYPAGFTDFAVTPVPGQYTLKVLYPTSTQAATTASQTVTATLPSANALPPMPPPSIHINADGSALVNLTVPGGVTEAILFISADQCVQATTGGRVPQNRYSIVTKTTGPQTLLLSGSLGPPDATGKPTDTFCTLADDAKAGANTQHSYSAVLVGFDYPAREASYPDSTGVAPAITTGDGHTGTADISTSPELVQVQYVAPAQ